MKKVSLPPSEPGMLLVGDRTEGKIFNIPKLALSVSEDRSTLHAGKNASEKYTKISDSIVVGLTDEKITDIFLVIR